MVMALFVIWFLCSVPELWRKLRGGHHSDGATEPEAQTKKDRISLRDLVSICCSAILGLFMATVLFMSMVLMTCGFVIRVWEALEDPL